MRKSDLQFVLVRADENQTIRFFDITADNEKSAWRAGVDLTCSTETLEEQLPRLMDSEFMDFGLGLREKDGERHLIARRRFGEGDFISTVRVLIYTSVARLFAFLDTDGNSVLAVAPLLHVPNLRGADDSIGEAFCVLVGCSRFISDYRPSRKKSYGANAEFRVDPSKGPNDGFLSLYTKTYNGTGIAIGKDILVDLGPNYTPLQVMGQLGQPAAKRFKGTLDLWVSRAAAASEDAVRDPGVATEATTAGTTGAETTSAGGAHGIEVETRGEGSNLAASGAAAAAGSGGNGTGAGGNGTGSGGGGIGGGGGPSQSSGAGSTSGGDAAAGSSAGEGAGRGQGGTSVPRTKIGSTDVCDLYFDADKLHLCNTTGKNKKVPPNTVLATFREGRVDEGSGPTVLVWKFTKPTDLVVWKSAKKEAKAITEYSSGQLGHYITANTCGSVHQHNKFDPKSLPSEFVMKKTTGFWSSAELYKKTFHSISLASATMRLAWIVGNKDGRVMPEGVAVLNKKEVTIKADEIRHFP